MKIYIQNSYVNGKDLWTKTISDALNVLVNWKGGKRPPIQQYESSEGVALTTKRKSGGFKGDCYKHGKYGHMDQDCPGPRK